MKLSSLCIAPCVALACSASMAATISVSSFDPGAYATQIAHGAFVGEDFESAGAAAGEGEVGPALTLDTGVFASLGGVGTGGTVRNLAGNTGTQLALRDGTTFGRRDAIGGRWYLDSNDTYGIGWDVTSPIAFDTVMFVLADGSDAGGFLRIVVDGVSSFEQRTGDRLANGLEQLVTVRFDQVVQSARIEMANFDSTGSRLRRNDGFSIDAIHVGLASVPLPPTGALLAAGIVGLWAWRRRQTAV